MEIKIDKSIEKFIQSLDDDTIAKVLRVITWVCQKITKNSAKRIKISTAKISRFEII